MANYFYHPSADQGTGDGSSEANAKQYSSSDLSNAFSTAGAGGTVFFLDGSYTLPNSIDTGVATLTLQSLNRHGATLSKSTPGEIQNGGSSVTSTTYKDFVVTNIIFRGKSTGSIFILDGIKGTISSTLVSLFHGEGDAQQVRNSSFLISAAMSSHIFKQMNNAIVENCTIAVDGTSLSANAVTNATTPSTFKNTILMSNTAGVIATGFSSSNAQNCCFHNVTGVSSGGTNNIFSDPQLVDVVNNDFRLRPSSPCINAGTAS
jgi:hypothetical protein